MFYSNNDGYMQDLYFYNQIPNGTYMNNFGAMTGNPNMQMIPNIQPGNPMMQTPNAFGNNLMPQNLNSLYPSIYRILNPVVSRVVSNNNQPISENLLENMTDTIFNIVEGQVDIGDDQVQRNLPNEAQNTTNSSVNAATTNSRNTDSRSVQNNSQNNFRNAKNSSESLLRDLIKILIIKELLSRNQMQRQFYQAPLGNSQGFFMNM